MIKEIKHTEDLKILGETIPLGASERLNFNMAELFTGSPIEIPVFVERSKKPGPTVLITAGIHGDEVNGMEVVREVISHKLNIPIKGTIICMPILNVFGFINKSRYFPDGRDLNRAFPGSKNGSLASRFAYQFVNEILPHADMCMDFHTGGADRFNAAQIRIKPDNETIKNLADIFNAPFTLYENTISGSYRETCIKMGIPTLLNESGKSLALDKMMAKEAIDGIKRVLGYLEMLHPGFEVQEEGLHKNLIITESRWIRAEKSGFLHIKINIHDFIREGDILATISDPYGQLSYTVHSENEGYIININQAPMVYQGDAIFHISTKTIHSKR